MNCRDATEVLDRMMFEEIPMDADLRQHADACPSCSRVYRDALKAREVMGLLRRSEPLLKDPEQVTENIMAAINQGIKNRHVSPVFLLQRLLAAASVALVLLFGYEQYIVVEKVSSLQTQFSQIKGDPRSSDPLCIASALYISKAGISFSEIERLFSPESGKTPLTFSIVKKRLDQRTLK
jgi:hypothetical protein